MKKTAKKSIFVSMLTVIAALIAFAISVSLCGNSRPAQAETYNSADNYNFTLVTDDSGNSSYKVAIKPTLRSSVTTAIVPDTYNGLPVTELAAGAFMSCSKLTKVILPESIKVINSNAFINCSQLKLAYMPAVESIGSAAFSMCGALDRLYIPQSVKSVGANILRNNANTVYIQSAAEELGDGWSSSWNDYHTGEVVYSATPESSIQYREIYNTANTEVIGYEISEWQTISSSDADVVIYNAYRPDESSPYLPVLNICQEAFSGVALNSLTIKARPEDDETFPVFDHKINIRSNAFFFSFISTINIETDVTFDHPRDLLVGSTENLLGETITGDENGHSVGVFEESLLNSITLPDNLVAIYDKMFFNCVELETIKIFGREYDGTNVLPNVVSIGDGAFSDCGMLRNISIPSSVTSMGKSVFFDWGTCVDINTHDKIKQEINIDFFKSQIPSGFSDQWADGIDMNYVTINYNEIFVTVDLCCDGAEPLTVSVVPGEQMPNIQAPERSGHEFDGVFTKPNGEGVQYYDADGIGTRAWQDGDPTVLYAYWKEIIYKVGLESDGQILSYVNATFGWVMPATAMPVKVGYTFGGYYYAEADGTKTYYYNADMSSAKNWNRTEDCNLRADWNIVTYKIVYANLKDGINPAENPVEYTVDSDNITFAEPYGRTGYDGKWDITAIPNGSVGDITVNAVWSPKKYTIKYYDEKNGINPNAHIISYTIESPTIEFDAPYGIAGYIGEWQPASIPHGSTGNIEVVASWELEVYHITFDNLLDGYNPNITDSYTIESRMIMLDDPKGREGYKGSWDIPEIPAGSTGHLTITAIWTPIQYSITYNIAYGINPNENIRTYTIESETIKFDDPTGRDGYDGTWDITSIPKGSTNDIVITAIWTPVRYNITYIGMKDIANPNPTTITCEDVVTLLYPTRSGYMLVGWLLGNQYVYTLENIMSDITLTAVWVEGKTVNLEKRMTKFVVTVSDMTIVLPTDNFTSAGCLIEVKPYITSLTIKLDSNVEDIPTYRMYIEILSRNSDMSLYLDNVSMVAPDSSVPTITMQSYTLNLYTTGKCGIIGLDGTSQYASSDNGTVAIKCKNLNIYKADNLTIRGGNGSATTITGVRAGSGAYAVEASGYIGIATNNVTLQGGDAGAYKQGASLLGFGADATNIEVSCYGCTVTIKNGSNSKSI